MSNDLITTENMISDIVNLQNAAKQLMKSKHYQKMGEDGIVAILAKAKSLNISAVDALNGGLYFVQGKVEMTCQMMNQLVRQAGHSIIKDPRSNDSICILHGKRKDNGDTWTESFSIDDAKRAGIYKNVWNAYPRNMTFARALSNLCRQLFPDILKNCYVQGEISESPQEMFNSREIQVESEEIFEDFQEMPSPISKEMCFDLVNALGNDQNRIQKMLEVYKISSIEEMKVADYEICMKRLKKAAEFKSQAIQTVENNEDTKEDV